MGFGVALRVGLAVGAAVGVGAALAVGAAVEAAVGVASIVAVGSADSRMIWTVAAGEGVIATRVAAVRDCSPVAGWATHAPSARLAPTISAKRNAVRPRLAKSRLLAVFIWFPTLPLCTPLGKWNAFRSLDLSEPRNWHFWAVLADSRCAAAPTGGRSNSAVYIESALNEVMKGPSVGTPIERKRKP